jgi:hypothetical protein
MSLCGAPHSYVDDFLHLGFKNSLHCFCSVAFSGGRGGGNEFIVFAVIKKPEPKAFDDYSGVFFKGLTLPGSPQPPTHNSQKIRHAFQPWERGDTGAVGFRV